MFPFLGIGCRGGEPVKWVDFEANLTEGSAPLNVQFSSLSQAKITQWWWFFGDGHSSTEPNPSHTYNAEGYYTITLVGLKGDSYETSVKEDYIRVGQPISPLSMQLVTTCAGKVDVPPNPSNSGVEATRAFVIDLAGEGVLYWTNYRVLDKYKVDDQIPIKYEHSIWIDNNECYGMLDGAEELWKFQQEKVKLPDAYYPAIYRRDKEDTQIYAFWRVDIPFNESLVFALENNSDYGTIHVLEATLSYSLVLSGMLPKGVFGYGHEWAINEPGLNITDFPKAPKIKAALEKEFGEKVYSVAINYSAGKEGQRQVLCVDAPDITRTDIKRFISEKGFVKFVPTE
ncbi:PKD domain-containing protein [Chloroflexota bacterium]